MPRHTSSGGTGEPGIDVNDSSDDDNEALAYKMQKNPQLIDNSQNEESKSYRDMRFTLSVPAQPKGIMANKHNEVQQYVSMHGNVLDTIDQNSQQQPEYKSVKELLDLNPGPGGMTQNESARMDRKGVPINRRKDGVLTKDRKMKMPHKIMFADQI